MAKAMKLTRILSGCAAAGLVAVTVASAGPAKAAGKKAKAVGGFQVQSINVAQGASVPGNIIVEVKCSQAVNPDSVNPATLQVRARNATNTGYSKQVFGSAQVVGNVIRFFPRLPTHLRDSTGKFYPQGSAKDSAGDNAAFQPQTSYQISVVGSPAITAITSTSGRKLKAGPANTTQFTIAAASPPERLWTALTYSDSPPPQFSFSNPPDTVPTAAGQYSTHGGTQDVPSAILMSMYCTKVPLSPGAARNLGNVSATMLARKGDYTLRRPVFGSVFVEQNFDTTLLAFQPQVALADLGIFSLRVTKGVKDLTEQNDFAPNRARDQLNTIYVFLSSARTLAPTVPVAQLPDPPAELITDWPKSTDPGGDAARGVLKTNVLALGDAYPDEIDPRTMLIFTTRDEPVTQDSITVEFTKSENLFDPLLSIGTVDTAVPGAAAAVFTASGGDASLGDLKPTGSNFIVPSSAYAAGAVLNYKDVAIPQGTTVTLAGGTTPTPLVSNTNPPLSAPATPPATLKCLTFQLDGQISADGANGLDGNQSGTYSANDATTAAGGAGGPGGGNGGISQFGFGFLFTSGSGGVGNDINLVPANATVGGRGGLGGMTSNNTVYAMGGGGGGGGSRTAGSPGLPGTYSSASWNGAGGNGGAAAVGPTDLTTLVGGAGGGGGAKAMCVYYSSGTRAGTGGGGGGAVVIQTAGILTINQTGVVHARGGSGGKGAYASPAMGGGAGGGGGGAVLLRSSRGFSFAAPTNAISVSGGVGGAGQTGSYPSGAGGNGGVGFAKLEDPNGGMVITGITLPGGFYNPVGAGVPSFVYTKWVDLGVQDPRVVQWKNSDVATVTTNDAIYVSAQMTKESPTVFGKPDLSALKTSDQSSTNVSIMSQWQPIKVHDLTGAVGGAFTSALGPIPGYPQNPPTEYAGFDPSPLIGKGYKFLRFRIYFQLDATQTATSPIPYVDRIVTTFQYNF